MKYNEMNYNWQINNNNIQESLSGIKINIFLKKYVNGCLYYY